MARLNLLPWREQLREERKKQFLAAWAITLLSSAAVVFLVGLYVSGGIDNQQSRNQYLQQQVSVLDRQIKEIEGLKAQRTLLLERMGVIQNLQGHRPVSVRIFDEVAKIVPEGVYFKDLKLEGNRLSLIGVAESNNRISDLMRNFDGSDWFTEPNLTGVRKISINGERLNEFDLTIRKVTPGQIGGRL